MTTLTPPQATDFPHGYSGETKTMTFTKHFTFTHPDHTQEVFPVGTLDVPVEVADHWYAQHHTANPPTEPPKPGTPAYADRLRGELSERNETNRLLAQQNALIAGNVNKQEIEAQVRAEFTAKLVQEAEASRAAIEAQVREEMTAKLTAEYEAKLAAETDTARATIEAEVLEKLKADKKAK